jgi:energy-coupling factor transporter ATP-binding protein EcfA2
LGLLGAGWPKTRARLGVWALGAALAWGGVALAWALGAPWGGLWLVGARLSCGAAWGLWLGAALDWPGLRRALGEVAWLRGTVALLDQSLMHGLLTADEWRARWERCQARLGRARLPLSLVSRVLGEGLVEGLERAERAQEAQARRGAAPAEPPSGALRLRGVRVEEEGRLLLDGFDFALRPGEWVGVCGASGAGKTTLLRVVAGVQAVHAGGVERLGRAWGPGATLEARLDGRVSWMTQNPDHHLLASTAGEDVAWGLLQRGVARGVAEEAARRWMERLGVGKLWERPCHRLSFGEQRRVVLAGGLAVEPGLLLLDEPTAGLDPVAARRLAQAVSVAAESSALACVWATHDWGQMPPKVERVVLLREGRVVFDGPRVQALTRGPLSQAGLWLEDENNNDAPRPARGEA